MRHPLPAGTPPGGVIGDDRAPLVSIVIPSSDYERFVAAAVESALSQSHRPVEVIVVDDASTDGTARVLERFGDRIRSVRLERRRGPSAARNVGLALARGEYVQFLDADDLLHPLKVEACLRGFGPDVDLVFTENEYFTDGRDGRGRAIGARALDLFRARPMAWDPSRTAEYFLRCEVQTGMPLHRTEFLRLHGGFREGLWSLEDVELHFRLVAAGARVQRIDRVLLHCRHHESPARLRIRPGRFTISLEALEEMRATAERYGWLGGGDGVAAALGDRYAQVGLKLLLEGRRSEANVAFGIAERLSARLMPTSFPPLNLFSRLIGLRRLGSIGYTARSLICRRTMAGAEQSDPIARGEGR